jgi:hypothetical protein
LLAGSLACLLSLFSLAASLYRFPLLSCSGCLAFLVFFFLAAVFPDRRTQNGPPKHPKSPLGLYLDSLGRPLALPEPTESSLSDLTFHHVFIDIFPSEARFPSSFQRFCLSFFADSL